MNVLYKIREGLAVRLIHAVLPFNKSILMRPTLDKNINKFYCVRFVGANRSRYRPGKSFLNFPCDTKPQLPVWKAFASFQRKP